MRIRRTGLHKAAVKLVLEEGPKKVLDYGCGDGRVCRMIGKKQISATGVDIDRKAIKKAWGRKNGGYEWYRVDDISRPGCFKGEGDMDVVVCLDVLEHINDFGEALKNIHMAAPVAVISVPNEPWFEIFSRLKGTGRVKSGHVNFWKRDEFKKELGIWYEKVEVWPGLVWNLYRVRK